MKALVDQLFIYIFIFVLLLLRIPDIGDDQYIRHKIIIFFSLLMFNFSLQLIKKIKSKCIVKTDELLEDSVKMALYGTLGYSIFTDLTLMESTKDYLDCFTNSHSKKSASASLVIVGLITCVKVFEIILGSKERNCNL